MGQEQEILLHIHCRHLPGIVFADKAAVRLGIQRGRDVIDDVPANVSHVVFTAPLRFVPSDEDRPPNFLGPYAQGTPQDRFLYLCWGERHGDTWEGFRRAKLPLHSLSRVAWEAVARSGQPVTVTVEMTDRHGGPVCGSLKPDAFRWQVPAE